MGYRIARLRFLIVVTSVVLALGSVVVVSSALASYTQKIDGSSSVNAVSCVPGTSDCVVSDSLGKALYATNVSASASATWSEWSGPGTSPSEALSCPTSSLCLLADGSREGSGGNLYYATSLGGAWTEAYSPTYGVDAISCSSSSFCVDGQDGAGYFRYSTSPASTSWTLEDQGSASMKGVDCLSTSFCAIAAGSGSVYVATSATQVESSSWTATDVDGSTALNGIACASTTSCVAVDGAGDVLNLVIAGNGGATASKHDIDGTNSLVAVTCTTASTCVTVDNKGNVFVSTNGGETWTNQYWLDDKLTSVSCSSASLCVTAHATGSVTAFDPAASGGPKNTALPSAGPLSPWSAWLEGQIFTATTGSWTGAEPISYSYQWQKCNAEGSACSNISGATASTFTPTSGDVGGTLRVIVTATNSEGSTKATSAAGDVIASQAAPEAHVVNSAGEIVQSYGETYAGGPGGQIQLAENFAHAYSDPKVTLDSGTFWLFPSSVQNVSNFAAGILAYSSITLEGTSGTEVALREGMGGATNGEGLSEVLGVYANPAKPTESGSTLKVSHIAINGDFEAAIGVVIGPESGSGLYLRNTKVGNIRKIGSSTIGTGIEVGDPPTFTYSQPVSGTEASPIAVENNEVYNVWGDGIAVTGSWVTVSGNKVYWAQSAGSNGVTTDSNGYESSHINIVGNRFENDHTGVGLDGSGNGGLDPNVGANVVIDTCIGIDLNVQQGGYVGDNTDYLEGGFNPETDKNPYSGGENGLNCGVPGNDSSVGVLIQNTFGSYVYGNYLDNWRRGVWLLWDGTLSRYFWNPNEAIGTQYNGVGLYYDKETKSDVGAGNQILLGGKPLVVEDYEHNELANWNALENNETEDSTEGCYYEHQDEEYIGGNTGAGCEQIS
jgi:hypothetical protein